MVYHKIKLHLSKEQAKKLLKGLTVAVKHADIGRGLDVHVDGNQAKRIATAMRKKKGCRIQMSQKQLKHNVKHGGALLDLLKSGFNKVKNFVQPYVRPALHKALDLATPLIASRVGVPGSVLANRFGHAGINKLGDTVGFGIKRKPGRPRKGKKSKGAGIFPPGY